MKNWNFSLKFHTHHSKQSNGFTRFYPLSVQTDVHVHVLVDGICQRRWFLQKRVNCFEKPPMSIICEDENRFTNDSGASFNKHWKCDGRNEIQTKTFAPASQALKDKACMSHKYSVNFDYSWRLMSFYELLIIMPFYRNGNSNVNAVGLTQTQPMHKIRIGIQSKGLQSCSKFESSRIIQWLIIGSTEWRGMRHNSTLVLSSLSLHPVALNSFINDLSIEECSYIL